MGASRATPPRSWWTRRSSWLEARSPDTPFFLYVAFAEPHGTIASPEFFTDLYSAFTKGRPDPFANGSAFPTTWPPAAPASTTRT